MNFYTRTRSLFCVLERNVHRATDRPWKKIQTSDSYILYLYGQNNLIMQNIFRSRDKFRVLYGKFFEHPIAISSAVKVTVICTRQQWPLFYHGSADVNQYAKRGGNNWLFDSSRRAGMSMNSEKVVKFPASLHANFRKTCPVTQKQSDPANIRMPAQKLPSSFCSSSLPPPLRPVSSPQSAGYVDHRVLRDTPYVSDVPELSRTR